MLFSIRLAFVKASAAVVIQNQLEAINRLGYFDEAPALVANKLIEIFCQKHVESLKAAYARGGLPNKYSLASCTIAFAIEAMPDQNQKELEGLQFALSNLLFQITSSNNLPAMKPIDYQFLEPAIQVNQSRENFEVRGV